MVWNYSNGKYVSKDKARIVFGEVGFLPRPTSVSVDDELLEYFEKAVNFAHNEMHILIGAMASGSAVVANRLILERQIKGRFGSTKGPETEGYGVAYAASHATEPRPKAIIAKAFATLQTAVNPICIRNLPHIRAANLLSLCLMRSWIDISPASRSKNIKEKIG